MTEITGTLDEMEPKLREAGFTAVQTYGGRMDLADFDPYGMRRVGSINIKTEKWAHHVWRGKFVQINDKPYLTDAKEPEGPFCAGLFPLLQGE